MTGRTARLVLLVLCLVSGLVRAQCSCGYGDGRFTINSGISIDGSFTDWSTVLADLDNNSCDGYNGINDRDGTVQSTGRDLVRFAYTWNSTGVQAYTERYGSPSNTQSFIYYADANNNGKMQTGERVIVALWKGNTGDVGLYYGAYVAVASGGDSMVNAGGYADGYTLPGTVAGLPSAGQPNATGVWGGAQARRMEWQVSWSVLGVAPGAAFTFHVSSTNSQPSAASFPAQVDDNTGGCGGGAASTQYADLTFVPNIDLLGTRGQTVYAPHIITNLGNGTDRFNLSAVLSGGHSPAVSYYRDADGNGLFSAGDTLLTDTNGDGKPDTGPVAAGASIYILAAYTIAANASGTATAVVTAASAYDFRRTATVTDTIALKPVIAVTKTVTPGSVASGGTVTYTITVINSGYGNAALTKIKDLLPDGFSYVATSTSGLTTANPVITSQTQLEWAGNWTVPARVDPNNGTVTLSFRAVAGANRGTHLNNVTVSGANFPITVSGPTAPATVTAPQLTLAKSADKTTAAPGQQVTYTIHYRNIGDGTGTSLILMDTVPFNTAYVPGSIRVGTAEQGYADATTLTDADDAENKVINGATVKATFDGSTVIVLISGVTANDDNPTSGPDEGKVFFKVTVN